MPIDASIPLSVNQPKPPDTLGQAAQAFTLKSSMLQSQQIEQNMKTQQALKAVMSSPDAFDIGEDGIPTPKPQTLQALAQHDPIAAQKLGEATWKMKNERLTAAEKQRDALFKTAGPVAVGLMTEYEQMKKTDPAGADAAIQPKIDAALAQLKAQGLNVPPTMKPAEVEQFAQHVPKYLENKMRATQPSTPHEKATEQMAADRGKREDARLAQGDRRIDAMEARAAASEHKAEALRGGFEGRNGEIAAALAEQGVSLPAGFRSKAQQLGMLNALSARHKDKTPDQIATLVKNGQITLSNLKTEGRIAAGIAGKVAYAEQEIEQTIPLVREASAKLPRGKFVPWNQLKQMGEEKFSDPDLAAYRMYMTSLSNAYDLLAARGGTDMEKRAHNRKNFDTATSPEALEAVLQAVRKEAQASGRAARETLKPPSERSGGGESASPDDPRPGDKPKKPLSAFLGG